MSFDFSVNHDEAFEGVQLIPEGEYEVIIAKAMEDVTPKGTEYINMHLVIRNDIDQKFKNAYIFNSLWKGKDSGKYHSGMLNTVAKSLNIENGRKYTSLEELLGDYKLKTARVTVKHEEYNGNVNARVKSWSQSKFNGCNHLWKEKQVDDGIHIDNSVDSEDIPF